MSELRVNNYGNQDGTQSVPAQYVTQGTSKSWVNYKGTVTRNIRSSLNISSVTNNGTGDDTFAFINAFSNSDHVSATTTNYAFSGAFSRTAALIQTPLSTQIRTQSGLSTTATAENVESLQIITTGILA